MSLAEKETQIDSAKLDINTFVSRHEKMDRKSYSSGQAAQLLGIPDRTIRRYLRTGKIRGSQNPITGTWQISPKALIEFVEKRGCNRAQFPFKSTILVADDDPAVADSIKIALDKPMPNVVVEKSQDACDALIRIGDIRPDIAVIEAKMSLLHGKDLLVAIKNNPKTKTVKILATGNRFEDLKELAEIGAEEILLKPFSEKKLLSKLKGLVPSLMKPIQ